MWDKDDLEEVKRIVADANYFQRLNSKHCMGAWLDTYFATPDSFMVHLLFTHKNRNTSLKTFLIVTKGAKKVSFGKQHVTGKRKVAEEIESYFSSEVDLIIEHFEQKYCETKSEKLNKIVYALEDN